MGVDYEQQLKDNADALNKELEKSNAGYDKMIGDYQAGVDKQQQQLDAWGEEQKKFQQDQTDFAIEQVNQQKEQAEKDYTKEQQASYGDYKRQTDPYGVNAEQMAALGLSQSGYSESSNVAMYTAYQNRVATARASFEQAKQTFDNAIREAKLTNDINLAKIAYEVLEKKLALSMDSIVYLGNLKLEKTAAASSIQQTYYDRAQDIIAAQQAEKAATQQEEILAALQGDYTITGDQGNTGGNEDFSAVDEFLKNWNLGEDELDNLAADMINEGIITMETVNGVDVYKVANEEKAKAYMNEHFGSTAPADNQGATGSQAESQQYTDEYTLLVEEYERLKNVYLQAQRSYQAATKWGPAPELKAAVEAAEKAYKNYPVKVNPDYEPQKKKVEAARAALQVAESKKPRKVRDIEKAKEKYEEELAAFNNMKPYTIIRRGNSSNSSSLTMGNNRNKASLR